MGYKSPRTYTLIGVHSTGGSPNDSTLYYIGGSAISLGTVDASHRITIGKSGIIRLAQVTIYSATAIGTNENWTISLHDGTTTTAIATVGAAAATRTWLNDNMNYPITAGGYIQMITTTPAWATNPEGCFVYWLLMVEYE